MVTSVLGVATQVVLNQSNTTVVVQLNEGQGSININTPTNGLFDNVKPGQGVSILVTIE